MLRARHRALLAFVCLAPLALATPAAEPADADCEDADVVPANDNLGRIAAAVACLINAERANRGEPPLQSAAELRVVAEGMSSAMVERKFFAHVTPDGRNLADRLGPTGYLPPADRWLLGENLAWGYGPQATPRAIVGAWMNSAEHRVEMLAPEYEDVGIGMTMGSPVAGRDGGTTFVADFGTRDTRPAVSVPSHVGGDARDVANEGISYRAECSRPCTLQARLVGEREGDTTPVVLGSGRLRLRVGGTGTVTLGLRRAVARSPERLAGADLKLLTRAVGSPVVHATRVTLR